MHSLHVFLPFVLLFVGSLIHRKGFDILMQAFDIVASHDERFYLLAVGPTRDELGVELLLRTFHNLCEQIPHVLGECR